jgi:hypothetical protein
MVEPKPALTLVSPATSGPEPPRRLGKHGRSLWCRVLAEYQLEDAGSLEILALAAQTLDRAETLAAAIRANGAVVQTRTGPRAHPAIRDETACRALCARLLARLGLIDEPLKPVGRPPRGGLGIVGPIGEDDDAD